jgi:GNAT superfamily N-acetyltransferase
MSHHALNREQFDFAFHPSTHQEMGGVPYHTVEVWPKESAESDWAKMHPGERQHWYGTSLQGTHAPPAASISWHHKTGEIQGIFTAQEHQRQGIATSMLGEARRIAGETRGVTSPRHSSYRTNSGEAWARSTGDRLPRRDQAS